MAKRNKTREPIAIAVRSISNFFLTKKDLFEKIFTLYYNAIRIKKCQDSKERNFVLLRNDLMQNCLQFGKLRFTDNGMKMQKEFVFYSTKELDFPLSDEIEVLTQPRQKYTLSCFQCPWGRSYYLRPRNWLLSGSIHAILSLKRSLMLKNCTLFALLDLILHKIWTMSNLLEKNYLS